MIHLSQLILKIDTLLTEVHNLSRFPLFLTSCHFSVSGTHLEYHIKLLCRSLEAPLGYDSFSNLACFWWPLTVLKSTGHVFCRLSLSENLSDIFLTICLGLWISGKQIRKEKWHPYHLISEVHTINMIYQCCCWSLSWGSVCRVSPLKAIFFSPFPHYAVLEEVIDGAHTSGVVNYAPPSWGQMSTWII